MVVMEQANTVRHSDCVSLGMPRELGLVGCEWMVVLFGVADCECAALCSMDVVTLFLLI